MKRTSYLRVFLPALFLPLAFALAACQEPEANPAEDETAATPEAKAIEVVAADYAFGAPEEIPSGWTTLRLNNEGAREVHEISLSHLPEGKTHEDYVEEFLSPWEAVWEQMQAGEVGRTAADAYGAASQLTPDWTADIGFVTARGLVSSGRSTAKTVYLEPGTYAMDCWVKAPDGTIHLSQGMTRELVVTEESSGESEPEAGLEIMLSSEGIQTDGELSSGNHTIAVRFDEDLTHDNVHLVRMEEDTDLGEVARWLNWYEEGGLQAPAPAEFLGGVHVYGSMPRGNTAYFTVEDVAPGRYAWIVEAPAEEELWETFAVE